MKRSLSTLAVSVRRALTPSGGTASQTGRSRRVAVAALMLLLVLVVGASGYLRGAQTLTPQGMAGGQLANMPSGAASGNTGAPYDPPTERTLPNGGKTSNAVRHDVSAPLRSVKPIPPAPVAEREENGVENGLAPFGPSEPVQDPSRPRGTEPSNSATLGGASRAGSFLHQAGGHSLPPS